MCYSSRSGSNQRNDNKINVFSVITFFNITMVSATLNNSFFFHFTLFYFIYETEAFDEERSMF